MLADVTSEDLKKYGLIPEIIGRFPLVTHVKPLSEEQLYQILIEPKNSVIKQYQKLFWIDNIELTFENDALKYVAKKAYELKTGARSLHGVLDKILADIMFDYGGYNKEKVKLNITVDMVSSYQNHMKEAA